MAEMSAAHTAELVCRLDYFQGALFCFKRTTNNEGILGIFGIVQGEKLEKAMAPHSSTLAWRIPGTGEPGGLLSMGLHRVGHN